jgi:hypothetical protein
MGGFDRFGRVADQAWAMYGSNGGGALAKLGISLDEYQYTCDMAGNRTERINAVDAAMSGLYGYNALNELTSMKRGMIGENGQIADPTYTQGWTWTAWAICRP